MRRFSVLCAVAGLGFTALTAASLAPWAAGCASDDEQFGNDVQAIPIPAAAG